MVRLKDDTELLYTLHILGFNSTMGQLKGSRLKRGKNGNGKFQFHNGSIKSALWERQKGSVHVFQFHNGSIKS